MEEEALEEEQSRRLTKILKGRMTPTIEAVIRIMRGSYAKYGKTKNNSDDHRGSARGDVR